MIEDGRVQDLMRVIVGKPETPTPELKSVINYETLNPYWHVTADLAKTLIAPRVLKEGNAYLTQQGYEVVSAFGPDARVLSPDSVDWKAVAAGEAQVYVRQLPGPANSLGHFKFDLPNSDGIYLHDTPKKELFANDERNLSHGCVRLEDAQRLARWLLGNDPPCGLCPRAAHRAPAPRADHHQLPRCTRARCSSQRCNKSRRRREMGRGGEARLAGQLSCAATGRVELQLSNMECD